MIQTKKPARPKFPAERFDALATPFKRFLHTEAAGGVVLLLAAVAALVIANSAFGPAFEAFWQTPIGLSVGDIQWTHSLRHWINDGLVTLFFFVVGLEIKREIVTGELSKKGAIALPLAAALGGMLVPAAIYLAIASEAPSGWGVVMATDIAFVVGCMAVLGKRIPVGLRVLLLTLAIADDIGAILVIAIGYSDGVDLLMLGLGAAGIALVALLSRLGVRSFGVYTLVGAGIWWCFHASGVHATIAGVILGLQTPARSTLDHHPGMRDPVDYAFDPEHFTVRSTYSQACYPWNQLWDWRESERVVIVMPTPRNFYVLPKRGMAPAAIDRLRGYLAQARRRASSSK